MYFPIFTYFSTLSYVYDFRNSFLSNMSVQKYLYGDGLFYVTFAKSAEIANLWNIALHSLEPPVAETKDVDDGNQWKLMVGDLVWGAARGSPAWPGKVESLGPPGTMTVWVRWYGGGGGRTQVDVKALKSLSEGLEAHHRARKKFRKWVTHPD